MSQLRCDDRTLKCVNAHSFDISREGYVNLLPSHHRKSLAPGDNTEMVAARRHFLTSGKFEPLVETLDRIIGSMAKADSLLDVGCGEGFFTDLFAKRVNQVYGVDVSKPAIVAASKQHKSIRLAVASALHLPVLDNTFDIVTVIMAPASEDVPRVLTTGGIIVRVTPGPNHLGELKKIIYRDARAHKRGPLELAQLKSIELERIEFNMMLDAPSRANLLAMTPMQYRTSRELQARTKGPETLKVTADFWIDVFKKSVAK